MSTQEPHPAAVDDASFLDDLLDSLTARLARGEEIDVEDLAAARPHLAAEIADTLRLAADIAVIVPQGVPTIPGYEIVRELGRGGMGHVFLARQSSLAGRLVALKVLPPGAVWSAKARSRFKHEALALAKIRHPNVIEVFDVLEADGIAAYAMEWVDGRTLMEIANHLHAHTDGRSAALARLLGPTFTREDPNDVIARWGERIAAALVEVHGADLLHRDVKPSNIMIRRDGTPLLMDFGLARDEDATLLTRTGAFLGTPAYASPEQLRGEDVDARADVCGLGATLYHALTGTVPYAGRSDAAILRGVEGGFFVAPRKRNPRLPRDLATIVETAMDPDLGRRYPSAAALREDLARYLARAPIHARPAGPLLRLTKYARRNRSVVLGVGLTGVVLVAIGIAIAFYVQHAAAIPARFAGHVRKARSLVLDPEFDEKVSSSLERFDAHNSPAPIDAVIGEYDRALGLVEDRAVRMARDAVALSKAVLTRSATLPKALATLAPLTLTAAERWYRTKDRVTDVELDAAPRADRRCLGLLALACGDPKLCIRAWRGLDLAAEPDPLVDAALGLLYLQQRQPAFAWPRLERAVQHFPDTGFLVVALADAALGCGDAEYAARLLRSRPLENLDPYLTLERVLADALWELGQRDEARRIYRSLTKQRTGPKNVASLIRFFLAEKDFATAAKYGWDVIVNWPGSPGAVRQLGRILAEWWQSLGAAGRARLLRSSLDAPGTFLDYVVTWKSRVRSSGSVPALRELAASLPASMDDLASLRVSGSLLKNVQTAAWVVGSPRTNRTIRSWRGLRDRILGELRELSQCRRYPAAPVFERVAAGVPGGASGPVVSADGRTVAFVLDDGSGGHDVGIRDLWRGTTRRLSVDGSVRPNGPIDRLALSADARFLAFYSRASNLVAGDTNGDWDCFVYDCTAGRIECVSVGTDTRPSGTGNCFHREPPSLDPSGDRVLFRRRFASGRDPWGDERVFVRDRRTLRTEAVTADARARFPHTDYTAVIVADGSEVLFASRAATEVVPDADSRADVFARSNTGQVRRLNQVGGRGPLASSMLAAATRCGRWVVLSGRETGFVTVDDPSSLKLFLLDRRTGSIQQVGRSAGEVQPLQVAWHHCSSVATDGAITAFVVSSPATPVSQIAVQFTVSRRGVLLSRAPNGEPADGACSRPAISQRESVLVFESRASNLVPRTNGAAPAVLAAYLRPLPPGSVRAGPAEAPRLVFHTAPRAGEVCHISCHGAPPGVDGVCVWTTEAVPGGVVRMAVRVDRAGVGRARIAVPASARSARVHFELGSKSRSERSEVVCLSVAGPK